MDYESVRMVTNCPDYFDDAGHLAIETKLITIDPESPVPPFGIKRVYFIYGTKPGTVRGKHAHRACVQLVVPVRGLCVFDLFDGHSRQSVTVCEHNKGLLIGPMIWHEMHSFTPDCVLVVLASLPYDEADYIRDYDEFVRLSKRRIG